jgi:hypothetical protein
MPRWRIVFSTFRECMSFYTARVIHDRCGRSHASMSVRQKVPRRGPQAHAIAPRAAPPFDPYSPINPYRPEAAGGGTPGYNQMLERY